MMAGAKKRQRVPYLDILRVVACLLVILVPCCCP